MRLLKKLISDDGAMKVRWGLSDDATIESVYLPFPKLNSFCLSTQVGCKRRCQFCSTGQQGFGRNLLAAEIVDQVHCLLELVADHNKPQELSFMGMGEPFDNAMPLFTAIDELRGSADTTISVSTVGVPRMIQDLADTYPETFLQVSLHATNDGMRRQLMPHPSTCGIAELLDAVDYYASHSTFPVHINYMILKSVNDHDEDAEALVQLLRNMPNIHLKLVGVNRSDMMPFEPASQERFIAFVSAAVMHGISVSVFNSHGRDIAAGCGQLIQGGTSATDTKKGYEQVCG